MSYNPVISKSRYIVTSVSGVSIENNVNKRPYTNNPKSYSKRKDYSKYLEDSLNSDTLQNLSYDDSTTFTNELENMVRLKSEENLRLVQTEFKDKPLNVSHKNTARNEFHNKLSQAMDVEVDISALYKKFELLNS